MTFQPYFLIRLARLLEVAASASFLTSAIGSKSMAQTHTVAKDS